MLILRELTTEHRRLAEIIEMIHTASLIHDDVLDDSNIRRGMLYNISAKLVSVSAPKSVYMILLFTSYVLEN